MTDLTKSLQDYLRAMWTDYTNEDDKPDHAARSGALWAMLEMVVSDIEANADPKTIEGVAFTLNAQIKAHTDAVA